VLAFCCDYDSDPCTQYVSQDIQKSEAIQDTMVVIKHRLQHLSFAVDNDSLLLCLLLLPFILCNPVQEILTTARVLYVLNAHVNTLGQDTTPIKVT